MTRPLALVLLAAALPARAQFQTTPMQIAKPAPYASLAFAPILAAPPSADVVACTLANPSLTSVSSVLFAARALPYPRPLPLPVPAIAPAYGIAGGLLRGDASGDLVWTEVPAAPAPPRMHVAFGPPPGTLLTYDLAGPAYSVAVAHLVPGTADAAVLPIGVGNGPGTTGYVYGEAFDATGGRIEGRWPAADAWSNDHPVGDFLHRVRLSPAALGPTRVDDLVLPMQDVAFVFWNGGGAAVGDALMTSVRLGDPANPAAHLPAGLASPVYLHGGAALDDDHDGAPNLFLAGVPGATGDYSGRLLEVPSGGTPTSFATRWLDVTTHPDLQPLPDVYLLRPLDLGAVQGMALFSAQLEEILVVTPGAAPGRFAVLRLPVPGLWVRDIFAADVVGSAAPDLVVDATTIGTPDVQWILVYPDAGDLPPSLAWAAGSPGVPFRGVDLPLAVTASDPDGSVRVDWILGTSADPVVASGLTYTVPGADLCDPAALPRVVVRATDDLGVYVELAHAFTSLQTAPPEIRIRDAVPPARLALVPGGTPAVFEADVPGVCGGSATFAWDVTGFPPPSGTVDAGASWSRWSVLIPEADDPALLDGGAEVLVTAVDDTGATTQATLALEPDGSALVAASDEADRATVAEGETVTVSTVLRSRIGLALSGVRVEWALAGLEPIGPPSVTGATVQSSDASGVVLDALPTGSPVRIDLPVRVVRAPSSAAFRAWSRGGFPLTPAAEAELPGGPLPGCGCESGGGATLALGGVAAALVRRRRADRPSARADRGARGS